jgi:SHS2 domain-containing protein
MAIGVHELKQLVVDLEVENEQNLLQNILNHLPPLHQYHRIYFTVFSSGEMSLTNKQTTDKNKNEKENKETKSDSYNKIFSTIPYRCVFQNKFMKLS